jgi:uncharacterized protein
LTDYAAIDTEVRAITRPHKNLLTHYGLLSLLSFVLAPIVFVPLYFRYHTLKYKFDEEGIGAQWGILFRREIYLSYKRIQDIHVKRNVVERWLGIGTVEVQTASGSSSAEMKLEGLERFDLVRDYLYRKMRGHDEEPGAQADVDDAQADAAGGDEVVELLHEIKRELAATREALEARS